MEIFYVLLLFIAAYFQPCLPLKTYLSKVDCVALNKQKIIFEYCLLQTDGHNVTTMSLKFRQLYGVVDDIKGHLKYTRRFNRSQQYRSIMPPIKFDFCKPFSNDMNPLIHASFALWQPYINVNHTCPLSQKAVIIRKFVTDERIFFWLPLQKGEYAIYITLFLYDVPSFSINLYFLIND